MADDYYEVLGVPRDATTQEIKRSFRQIARECHPDVSGGDPAAEDRFKRARQAYETLMDPVTRARYDRRGQRRRFAHQGGSFFDAFYRATGEAQGGGSPAGAGSSYASKVAGGGPRGQKTGRNNPGNDVSLDDLMGDFGFGGGRARTGAPPPRAEAPRSSSPQPGDDVRIDLEVPADVAERGGSVTAVYYRMQRADSWRPGAADPGLVRIQDIADVRIIPGTRAGQLLRERGLGNAGAWGGPYGDLVATVRIVAPRRTSEPPRGEAPPPDASSTGDGDTEVVVTVSMVEAVLGGRVTVETPQGPVKLSIPPGTSGGTRMRLKGRGPDGSDGRPTDLYVVTRVSVPRELDAESRRLIEEFARLNPST